MVGPERVPAAAQPQQRDAVDPIQFVSFVPIRRQSSALENEKVLYFLPGRPLQTVGQYSRQSRKGKVISMVFSIVFLHYRILSLVFEPGETLQIGSGGQTSSRPARQAAYQTRSGVRQASDRPEPDPGPVSAGGGRFLESQGLGRRGTAQSAATALFSRRHGRGTRGNHHRDRLRHSGHRIASDGNAVLAFPPQKRAQIGNVFIKRTPFPGKIL